MTKKNWALKDELRAPITLAPIGKIEQGRKKRKTKMPPEQRAASGERMRALWQDPEFRAKRLAASIKANKAKWADPEYRAKIQSNLEKYHNDPIRLARTRVAIAKRFDTPGERERASQQMRQLWEDGKISVDASRITPAGKRKRAVATTKSHNKKRGFSIPPHLRKDYDHLVYSKKIKSREAGKILGLI
jgi:hypothetical protein